MPTNLCFIFHCTGNFCCNYKAPTRKIIISVQLGFLKEKKTCFSHCVTEKGNTYLPCHPVLHSYHKGSLLIPSPHQYYRLIVLLSQMIGIFTCHFVVVVFFSHPSNLLHLSQMFTNLPTNQPTNHLLLYLLTSSKNTLSNSIYYVLVVCIYNMKHI